MSDVSLTLGPVVFHGFEVPSDINFGGQQLLAVHRLTSGRRIVDSIGPAESNISFSGTFSGPTATLRARVLNSLRVAGDRQSLTWDVFYYTVILNYFEADYQNLGWVPYRLSCTVLHDEAVAATPLVASINEAVLGDLDAAAGLCPGLNMALSASKDTLADPLATKLGSSSYAAALMAIDSARSAIGSQISDTEASLGSSALTAILPALLPIDVAIAVAPAGQLARLVSAGAYTTRAARNLSNASS